MGDHHPAGEVLATQVDMLGVVMRGWAGNESWMGGDYDQDGVFAWRVLAKVLAMLAIFLVLDLLVRGGVLR